MYKKELKIREGQLVNFIENHQTGTGALSTRIFAQAEHQTHFLSIFSQVFMPVFQHKKQKSKIELDGLQGHGITSRKRQANQSLQHEERKASQALVVPETSFLNSKNVLQGP